MCYMNLQVNSTTFQENSIKLIVLTPIMTFVPSKWVGDSLRYHEVFWSPPTPNPAPQIEPFRARKEHGKTIFDGAFSRMPLTGDGGGDGKGPPMLSRKLVAIIYKLFKYRSTAYSLPARAFHKYMRTENVVTFLHKNLQAR